MQAIIVHVQYLLMMDDNDAYTVKNIVWIAH